MKNRDLIQRLLKVQKVALEEGFNVKEVEINLSNWDKRIIGVPKMLLGIKLI